MNLSTLRPLFLLAVIGSVALVVHAETASNIIAKPELSTLTLADYKEACAEKEGPKVRTLVKLDVLEDRLNEMMEQLNSDFMKLTVYAKSLEAPRVNSAAPTKPQLSSPYLIPDLGGNLQNVDIQKMSADDLSKIYRQALVKIERQAITLVERFVNEKIPNMPEEVKVLRKVEGARILADFRLNLILAATAEKAAGKGLLARAKESITQAWDQLLSVDFQTRALKTPGLLARLASTRINYEQIEVRTNFLAAPIDLLNRFNIVFKDAASLLPKGEGRLQEQSELDVLEIQANLSLARSDPGARRPYLYLPESDLKYLADLVHSLAAKRQELIERAGTNLQYSWFIAERMRTLELIAPFFLPDSSALGEKSQVKQAMAMLEAELKAQNPEDPEEANQNRERAAVVLFFLAKESYGTRLGLDLFELVRKYRDNKSVRYSEFFDFYVAANRATDGEMERQLGAALYAKLRLPGISELMRSDGTLEASYHGVIDNLARFYILFKKKQAKEPVSEQELKDYSIAMDMEWTRMQCLRVAMKSVSLAELKFTQFETLSPDFKPCASTSDLQKINLSIAPKVIADAIQRRGDSEERSLYAGTAINIAIVFIPGGIGVKAGQKVSAAVLKQATTRVASRVAGAALANMALKYYVPQILGFVAGTTANMVVQSSLLAFRNWTQHALLGLSKPDSPWDYLDYKSKMGLFQFFVRSMAVAAASQGVLKLWDVFGQKMPTVKLALGDATARQLARSTLTKSQQRMLDLKMVPVHGAFNVTKAWTSTVAGLVVDSLYKGPGELLKIKDRFKLKELFIDIFNPRVNPFDTVENAFDKSNKLKLDAKDFMELGRCKDCMDKAKLQLKTKIQDTGP